MIARNDPDATLKRLSASAFRRRFHLDRRERTYLHTKGRTEILQHARSFIAERLAPAHPPNDGKQTPMRGHPVFVAQHATATCCRDCIAKWHGIATGRSLTQAEQDFAVALIARWIDGESQRPMPSDLEASQQQAKRRHATPAKTDDDAQHDLFAVRSDIGKTTN